LANIITNTLKCRKYFGNWVMGINWKNLEKAVKRLLCYKWSIKGNSGEGLEEDKKV
jgi:hypothetical protein